MKYPYDLNFYPPFPMLQLVLHNDEEGLRTSAQNALLDTGSNGNLMAQLTSLMYRHNDT